MKFDPPLEAVTLLRRYKRFMADVVRADGSEITVHCPNTGSMKNCVLGEPQQALISDSGNPKRKYRHTLEACRWPMATGPGSIPPAPMRWWKRRCGPDRFPRWIPAVVWNGK